MIQKFNNNFKNPKHILAKGITTSMGVACGHVVFSQEQAINLTKQGHKVILVKDEILPNDVNTLLMSDGIISTKGQIVSNASMMAKTWKKCYMIAPSIILQDNHMIVDGRRYPEGTLVSMDGYNGNIYLGHIPMENHLSWNDMYKKELKNKQKNMSLK